MSGYDEHDRVPPSDMRITKPTIRLLPSGYWHVRWSRYQFAQWPNYQRCTLADIFPHGWETGALVNEANALADEWKEPEHGD